MTKSKRPLFKRVPRTEQDVVCLFGALLPYLPEAIRIDKVQTGCPDCLATRIDDDRCIRIEFELYGRNFNHPLDGCDVVVCWRDDRGRWPEQMKVWELHAIVRDQCGWMIENLDEGDISTPWNWERFEPRAKADGMSDADLSLARSVVALAREYGFGPKWRKGSHARIVVGTDYDFFKVNSDGKLVFMFSNLVDRQTKKTPHFEWLIEKLNDHLDKNVLQFTDKAERTKTYGVKLSKLFNSEQQLREFFEIWREYTEKREQN